MAPLHQAKYPTRNRAELRTLGLATWILLAATGAVVTAETRIPIGDPAPELRPTGTSAPTSTTPVASRPPTDRAAGSPEQMLTLLARQLRLPSAAVAWLKPVPATAAWWQLESSIGGMTQDNSGTQLDRLQIVIRDQDAGRLQIEGKLTWPLQPGLTDLTLAADRFKLGYFEVTGQISWHPQEPAPLELRMQRRDGLTVAVQGRLEPWLQTQSAGVDVILRHVRITRPPAESAKIPAASGPGEDPLLPWEDPTLPFPLRLQVDRLDLESTRVAEKILLQSQPAPRQDQNAAGTVRLVGRMHWCDMAVDGDLSIAPQGRLTIQLQGRLRDAAFSSLLACGLALTERTSPPVYLEGRSSGNMFLAAQGTTAAELKQTLQGDLSLNVRDARIMRLSNIRSSWGFILDMLRLVNLNPTRLRDTLPLDSMAVRGIVVDQSLNLHQLAVDSSLLQAAGSALIDFKPAAPTLDLAIQLEAQGIRKELKQHRVLQEPDDEKNKIVQ